eukprot:4511089-Pyramimonas_sp.AAC.1
MDLMMMHWCSLRENGKRELHLVFLAYDSFPQIGHDLLMAREVLVRMPSFAADDSDPLGKIEFEVRAKPLTTMGRADTSMEENMFRRAHCIALEAGCALDAYSKNVRGCVRDQ